MSLEKTIHLRVNGNLTTVEVPITMSTLAMLRDLLKLTGTKSGCEEGECGACTILVDGVSVNACLMFAVDCDGREVTTIEGIRTAEGLSPLQELFVQEWAVQCGFCTPGIVVAGTHLLEGNPQPSEIEIREALSGNICRCTGYGAILRAFDTVARGDV